MILVLGALRTDVLETASDVVADGYMFGVVEQVDEVEAMLDGEYHQ